MKYAQAERCVLWIHDEERKVLWTFNKKLMTNLSEDLSPETLIATKDSNGFVGVSATTNISYLNVIWCRQSD
jgi:hypothetical protein